MLLALAVLPLAGPAVPAPQQIESKEAEAREVLAQIQELDSSLEHVIDEYNNAQVELDKIVAAQKLNEKRLKIARANLGTAQGTLEARLVQLYQNGSPDLVEILLGSSSLDEILDGIDTAAGSATRTRRSSKRCASSARRSSSARPSSSRRSKQEQVVAERAGQAQRDRVDAGSAPGAADSIKDQIAEMRAAERGARLASTAAEARLDRSPPVAAAAEGRFRPRSTAASSASPCSTSASRTSGAASPRAQASTAPASPTTSSRGRRLLPARAAQYAVGVGVSRSQLAPGDLVFFNGLGHVGIYIGGNQFIHSPHTGDVVKISSITGYYSSRLRAAHPFSTGVC